MKKEMENIEDLFKSELENLQVTPDSSMEDQIADQIDFNAVERSRRFNRFLVYVLIISLISVGGCVTLIFSGSQNNNYSGSIVGNMIPSLNYNKVKPTISALANHHSSTTVSNLPEIYSLTSSNSGAGVSNCDSTYPPSNYIHNSDARKNDLNRTKSATHKTHKNMSHSEVFPPSIIYYASSIKVTEPEETEITARDSIQAHLPNENSTGTSLEPLVKINTPDHLENYKHSFGIGTVFSLSSSPELTIGSGDTSWTAMRNPLTSINIEYAHALFSNFNIQSGFQYERWTENWERNHDTSLLVTKDTIIDGTPSIITFLDTIKRTNKYTYTTTNFGIPIALGYHFNITGDFSISFGLGGLLSGTRVKQHTTYFNSNPYDQIKKQTVLSFSPRYNIGFNYAFNQMGIGLNLNYSKPRLDKIDLFERQTNRNNIGVGVRLFYRF
jgi:hypothetical protein